MAVKVILKLIDDLDGDAAEETVTFGLDGKIYEIDLSGPNANRLRAALQQFVDSARYCGRSRPAHAVRRAESDRPADYQRRNHAIRDWARKEGRYIPDRGRIPKNVIEAYHQRH